MTRRANEFLRVAVVALLAVLLAPALARTSWRRAIENAYYDWWHVLWGVRYEPRRTVVVAVDDETLAALKDDPLTFCTPHFGRAVDVLAQAAPAP